MANTGLLACFDELEFTITDVIDVPVDEAEELSGTPHHVVSSLLRAVSEASQQKLADDIAAELGLDPIDARTLALAAASPAQLRQASKQVRQKRVGKHQFSFIEVDIVTWRILPSPENIRFEDQRSGIANVYRYGSVPDTIATLHLEVEETTQIIDQLERQTAEILRDNPHAATIPRRGIEVAGLLSLARADLRDRRQTVGYLDATDGFSRTAGAHSGLGISPRDVLLRLANSENEAKYRRELIRLRDSGSGGLELSDEQERRLRSSVMARAQVIVGYELIEPSGLGAPAFDRARRTLVGHIHMAPAHPFTPAAQWAAKANAIRESLLSADQLPSAGGLDRDTVFDLLSGNSELLDDAEMLVDEYAVVVLEAFRPLLTTKRGRAVQSAVQDLTGQKVTTTDLAMIAAEVALRPLLQRRNLSTVQAESTLESLRSVLGRAWDSAIFGGAQLSSAPIPDLLEAALEEHRYQKTSSDLIGRAPKSARSELAALASFNMVSVEHGTLLQRAVGRKNAGANMAEPNQVIGWMYRTEHGLTQMAQTVLDARAGRTPQLLPRHVPSQDKTIPEAQIATAESLRELHRPDPTPDRVEPETPTTPQEKLNGALSYLTDAVTALRQSVDAVAAIRSNVGGQSNVVLVEQEGAVVRSELDTLMDVNLQLHSWQRTIENLAKARRSAGTDDDDDLD